MAGRNVQFDIIANDKASRTFDKVGAEAERTGGRLGKLGGAAKVAGLAIGGAAVGGVLAFGAALTQGVKDAAAYQDLAARTANVLKQTGNVAGTSVAGVQELAGKLESLSGVDEELIINSQNVLATFTSIRNVGKDRIFDQATASALDMSVALGTDLQGATILVGKALNDPLKGITALSRSGVSFTKQQKDQIKAMVEAGDTMGAQKLILGELNKEFGGAAKAAGQGFNGSLARLKDTIGDTFRNLGTKLLPKITELANWLNAKGVPAVIAFGEKVGPYLGKAFGAAWRGIQVVFRAGQRLGAWFKNEFLPAIRPVVEQALPAFKRGLDTIKSAFASSGKQGTDWQGILRTVGQVVITVAKVAIPVLAAAFQVVAVNVKSLVFAFREILWPALKFVTKLTLDMFGAFINGAASAFGWIPGLGPKLKTAAANFNKFRDSVNASLDGIRDQTIVMRIVGKGNVGGNRSQSKAKQVQDIRSQRAVGGYVRPGSYALVGENGPEYAYFPSGGTVMTAGQSARSGSGAGGGVVVQQTIHVHGSVIDSRELLRITDQAKRRAQSARTYVPAGA